MIENVKCKYHIITFICFETIQVIVSFLARKFVSCKEHKFIRHYKLEYCLDINTTEIDFYRQRRISKQKLKLERLSFANSLNYTNMDTVKYLMCKLHKKYYHFFV